jgi:hypothetical protein
MHRAALLLVLAGISCGPYGGAPPPGATAEPTPPVAVLPFRIAGFLDPAGRFVDDTSVGAIPDDLGVEIAQRLGMDLEHAGVGVVPADTVLRATPVAGAALYDTKLAARVAREVGADVAVMGAVHRYVQRVGSALSVERPATVEYQAMIVAADSGRMLGSYLFDFTQKPLAEDLTTLPDFLQGGGKWRTREEILHRSLTKTAAKIASALRSRQRSELGLR